MFIYEVNYERWAFSISKQGFNKVSLIHMNEILLKLFNIFYLKDVS